MHVQVQHDRLLFMTVDSGFTPCRITRNYKSAKPSAALNGSSRSTSNRIIIARVMAHHPFYAVVQCLPSEFVPLLYVPSLVIHNPKRLCEPACWPRLGCGGRVQQTLLTHVGGFLYLQCKILQAHFPPVTSSSSHQMSVLKPLCLTRLHFSTGPGKKTVPRLREFCSCCCLPLLPGLA